MAVKDPVTGHEFSDTEIAEIKAPDLNAHTTDMAMRIVEGTARSMGIEVEG